MGGLARDELFLSFESDYFCIEDILATQIKIPCKTNVDVLGFGFLDPSLNNLDLPKGSAIELPVWAAQLMVRSRRNYVTVEVPTKYKKTHREIIRADATVLDLNKWGPYYYQSGIHITCLPVADREAIREALIHLFQMRMIRLSLSYSFTTKLHSVNESSVYYKAGNVLREHLMDNLEHRVYNDTRKGASAIQKWMETPSRPYY